MPYQLDFLRVLPAWLSRGIHATVSDAFAGSRFIGGVELWQEESSTLLLENFLACIKIINTIMLLVSNLFIALTHKEDITFFFSPHSHHNKHLIWSCEER